MKITKPTYYDRFSCLAGACPDTCCGSWRVVIDPDSLARYRSIGGALGARVAKALDEADGEACFAMEHGRCKLLTEEGLCLLQAELGPQALCTNCDRYPRYVTQIGDRRELGLSLSCPEAARRILTEPFELCFEQTDEPLTDFHDLSPERVLTLRALRERALELAADRSMPFGERCARILLLCDSIDRGRPDCEPAEAMEAALEAASAMLCPADASGIRRFLGTMRRIAGRLEYLKPESREALDAALRHDAPAGFRTVCPALPDAWERLLCYAINKYIPRAAFDRAVWPAAAFSVTMPLLLRQMMLAGQTCDAGTLLRHAWTLARELEHSEENMAQLFRSFRWRSLRCENLAAVLAAMDE